MIQRSPVIELNDVCFSYRKREVLHNVGFQVQSSDMMAIVGPNGGGKTTLLLLILGLLNPNRGRVLLFGEAPQQTRKRVGYVPQNLSFDNAFPITALDVVKMGCLHRKQGKHRSKEIRESAVEALTTTGCGSLIHAPFASLSGGERQRVMIAHALVGKPELLLLDEPTANVDPKSEHELYELFQEMNRSIPIVFVSHNLSVVSRHVSHVLCVNHTAAAHPIGEILHSTFTELYGGKLALLSHDMHCHVTDASHAYDEPHSHEPGGDSHIEP
jgi:zinc transport system ATP-binding protein